MDEELIYSLSTEDIQTVATQTLNRELSKDEIELVKDLIAKKINWFDAIQESILEKIDSSNKV
jgi:hypothetical protein